MRRIAIYFFWDKDGIVDDYNIYMLADLRKNTEKVIVVSNGEMEKEGYAKFEKVADLIIERENKGFDVWAYKKGIEYIGWDELAEYDELILMNFTNYGPVYPFAEMFKEMDRLDIDFWGITEHYGHEYDPYGKCKYGYIPRHIQSSFIAVRKRMINSEEFHEYWERMPEVNDYADAICLHEAIFTEDFTRKGFKSSVYVKTQDLRDYSEYPLMLYPLELVKNRRCPIFKRKTFYNLYEEFLDVSCGQSAMEFFEYLKNETDYKLDLIWDNLLRTANMADIKERMQLNYVLPAEYSKRQGTSAKVALFMHIYNMDLVGYCKQYAQNIVDNADILITTDTKEKEDIITNAFRDLGQERIKVILIENRGRDVSALLVGLKPYYEQYDYICFAHDKKSEYDKPHMIGESFAYHCFENVLGSKDYVNNIVTLFDENPRLGLAVPPTPCHGSYYYLIGTEWRSNYSNVKKLIEQWGWKVPISEDKAPVAPYGSVFWFRAKALQPLFSQNVTYDNFEPEPCQEKDGEFPHAIERIHPFAAQRAGYYSAWVMSDKYGKLEITNLHKMLRDANQTMFWNFGIEDRHQTLHKMSCAKNELEVTKLSLIKSWDETAACRNEIETWKYPRGIKNRVKMIIRCILGKRLYGIIAKCVKPEG